MYSNPFRQALYGTFTGFLFHSLEWYVERGKRKWFQHSPVDNMRKKSIFILAVICFDSYRTGIFPLWVFALSSKKANSAKFTGKAIVQWHITINATNWNAFPTFVIQTKLTEQNIYILFPGTLSICMTELNLCWLCGWKNPKEMITRICPSASTFWSQPCHKIVDMWQKNDKQSTDCIFVDGTCCYHNCCEFFALYQ